MKISNVKNKQEEKALREKQLLYKGTSIRLSVGFFLAETLQARRKWHDIFKVLKQNKQTNKNFQWRISYLVVIIQNWSRDKKFLDKQKVKEFITTEQD